MLNGFTAPRSVLGAAALVPSPPWHFAGDVLAVEFWNDPEVSIHALPIGVELDQKCPGRSVALFTDYQFTAQNNEYLDPARYQCRGFSVLLDAMWNGTRIAWCPYCYVDNDAALMRGWIQGYPRKLGTIHQTRTFATASMASAPLVNDGRFSACMSAHGRLLVQASVTLREKVERLEITHVGSDRTTHPMAYTHPVTGKKVLFYSTWFFDSIPGMDAEENEAFRKVAGDCAVTND